MNSINWLELMPFGQAIGWTIIHSLWQLTLVGLGLRLVLFILPQKKANARYGVLLLGLLLAVIWMGITFSSEWDKAQPLAALPPSDSFQQEQQTEVSNRPPSEVQLAEELSPSIPRDETNALAAQISAFSKQISPFIPIIAISWYIGVLLLSAFMIFGFFQLKQLKTKGVQPPTEDWQLRFEQLKKQMGIFRFVQFSISNQVEEPITFHFFKPVVLAPISIFSGLSTDQIEVLLLHELAHIRRHDFLVNIIQSIVEVLCFYHPTVWWISGKIREEREHGCDDLVLQVRNKPMLYAEALTQLQVFHHPLKTNLAMSAKGKKGTFSKRIFRLFGQYDQRPSVVKGSLIALLLLVSLLTQAFYAPSIVTEEKLRGEQLTMATTLVDAPTNDKTEIISSLNEEQGTFTQDEAKTVENDPTLLFDAVHHGNAEVVRLLIKQGMDVNLAKSDGRTLLIEAAHVSEFEVAQLLINKGANVNQAAQDGYTALMEASEHGGFALVQFLLMHGADINHASEDGHTALLEAAGNGHYDIAGFLLENGADPTAKTKDGWDVMREAAASDSQRTVEALQRLIEGDSSKFIEPEISIDWSNSVNNSHYYAEIWKKEDATYVQTLHQLNRSCSDWKRASRKTKIINNQGKENSLIFTIKFGNQVSYDTLKNCVHPDQEAHQNTFEQKEIVYPPNRLSLPEVGLPPYVKVFNLKSPIGEQLEIFIELAKDAAQLRVGLLDEKTEALVHYITDGYIERGNNQMKWDLASRNVESGTYWLNVSIDNYSWQELVQIKASSPSTTKVAGDCQALLKAVKAKDVAKVGELLKTIDPNCEYRDDGEPRSPLVAAARNGSLEIGKLIMAANGKVGYHTQGDETPLMAAAANGHLDFVKFLVAQGAKVNKKLSGDGTPLIKAAQGGHLEVVRYLIGQKANINAKVGGDGTALICAVRNRHFGAAKLLLENGADPYAVSPGDEYAMYHARMNKDKDMIKLLQEYEKGK